MLPRHVAPIRVALCIDDAALRARVAAACAAAGIAVAATTADGGADLVVADRPLVTTAPVIVVVAAPADEAGAASAHGWARDIRARVPADLDAATLVAVIAVVAAGFAVTPHRIENRAGHARGSWAEPPNRSVGDVGMPALTPRECEVLALLAAAASNKAIARALSVSVHTAKFHVASLAEKLGASSRQETVAIALRAGLVMV